MLGSHALQYIWNKQLSHFVSLDTYTDTIPLVCGYLNLPSESCMFSLQSKLCSCFQVVWEKKTNTDILADIF